MLFNVPNVISPQLLMILHEMGHGDEICLGDGNFPASSMAKANNAEYLRLDGLGVNVILDAILTLVPLDEFTAQPVKLMEKPKGDTTTSPIWGEYAATIAKHDSRGKNCIQFIDRFAFYEHAKQCYAIVATSEQATYANIILKKGVIKSS